MATKFISDLSHSELEFKVRHLMISTVKGKFEKFEVEADGEDIFSSNISVTVDTASINTNSTDRDNHLRSADFFESEKYPAMTFKSRSFTKKSDDEYTLTGDLTIKGITKEITIDVEYGGKMKDPWGNEKHGFSLDTKFNRKDFGLNWNAALEAGGVMVSDEVKIHGEIQLLKQA